MYPGTCIFVFFPSSLFFQKIFFINSISVQWKPVKFECILFNRCLRFFTVRYKNSGALHKKTFYAENLKKKLATQNRKPKTAAMWFRSIYTFIYIKMTWSKIENPFSPRLIYPFEYILTWSIDYFIEHWWVLFSKIFAPFEISIW